MFMLAIFRVLDDDFPPAPPPPLNHIDTEEPPRGMQQTLTPVCLLSAMLNPPMVKTFRLTFLARGRDGAPH